MIQATINSRLIIKDELNRLFSNIGSKFFDAFPYSINFKTNGEFLGDVLANLGKILTKQPINFRSNRRIIDALPYQKVIEEIINLYKDAEKVIHNKNLLAERKSLRRRTRHQKASETVNAYHLVCDYNPNKAPISSSEVCILLL